GYRLTGHVDLVSIVDDHARLIDWKTGRNESADYYAQLAGYAMCLLGRGCKEATASVVWLRSQTIETFRFERVDALEFDRKIQAHLGNARYSYGEHCAHCPRSHACEALVAISRRDVAVFSTMEDVDGAVQTAPAALVVAMRRRAKVIEAFAKSFDESVRRRIDASGPLDSGDGYALSLVEENGKREVDTLKAWPILQASLGDEEIAECVTVSARAADEAVAKKAGRGNGAAAKRKLAADLEAAGAVSQSTIQKLKEVRLPKEIA
ncbi:MAG: PD-(D/E)XK nuclease family protein, partial [Candidatus Binataceae bacterium]